jgi:hypothetical protein
VQEIIATITIGLYSLEWHCTRADCTLHVVENTTMMMMMMMEFDSMTEEVKEGWRNPLK